MLRQRLAFVLAAAAVLGAATMSSQADEPVGPRLTPKLRDTLREEMRQVLGASQDILAALVAGDHVTVAERAQNIHDSFILEQSLSEQDLRDLKQAMGMDALKCKTAVGVLKELHAYAMAYNLVRVVMAEAAGRQGTTPGRISFVDALRWLRDAAGGALPRLVVNPDRPGRVEPRVRKRRPRQFPLMTRPRSSLKQDLIRQSLVA